MTATTEQTPNDEDDEALMDAESVPALFAETQPVARSLQVAKTERTIWDLYRRWKDGDLEISPSFTRGFVWDTRMQALLIESIVARIPLPVFYLSEENETETLVIDGQQRLAAIFHFLDGHFALHSLELFPELSGKKFADLGGRLQRRIENTPLTCFTLQPGTDPEVKFVIFKRLNTLGAPLNEQEVRRALFHGKGLDFLSRLAIDSSPGSFRDIAGEKRVSKRMKAEELLLDAFAFLDLGFEKYIGNQREFLTKELVLLNEQPERHFALEARLRNALAKTKYVFGEHSFCRYNPGERAWRKQLNASVMEVILVGFDRCFPESKTLSQETADTILSRFQRLSEQKSFHDAITNMTRSPSAVRTRFGLWIQELSDVE